MCALGFNGIDWVWSKSPFGQIISTHFRFHRPVQIQTIGEKGLRKSLLSSESSIRNSILVKKGYKAVNELTLVWQKRSVLIYRELFEREEKPGRIEIDRYEARGKVVRKIGARRSSENLGGLSIEIGVGGGKQIFSMKFRGRILKKKWASGTVYWKNIRVVDKSK